MNVATLRSKKGIEKASENNNESKESEKTQLRGEFMEEQQEEPYTLPPPYKPHLPFMKIFINAKKKDHFKKFVYILKKLYIIIPFT